MPEAFELSRQRRLVRHGPEFTPLRHRDPPPLFRDHQAERIGPLREPERRRVPRPLAGELPLVVGERQMGGEVPGSPLRDHERPVVALGMRVEEALQERDREHRVQPFSARQVTVDRVFALKDHERSDSLLREIRQ